MSFESDVADHYAGADFLAAIRTGMDALGKTPATVTVEDLGPVDEFHIGGRMVTSELCEHLGVTAETEVLDIGCGSGGAARFVASTFGCQVTGIDLTPGFVDVAEALTEWTGLSEQIRFEVGSALDMPFDDGSFDRAIQLHLGMNIRDKAALFGEAYRVLRPGARLVVYDIMRLSDGEISYPVPWASDSSTDFAADVTTYRQALEAAGFVVVEERDRAELALEFFEALEARAAEPDGPPPLGLHLHMGVEAPAKVANMIQAVDSGILAPVEMIGEKPAG